MSLTAGNAAIGFAELDPLGLRATPRGGGTKKGSRRCNHTLRCGVVIHGVVFEPEQLKEFRRIIYQNMIKAMRVLVDANRKLNIPLRDPVNRKAGDEVLINILHSNLDITNLDIVIFVI